MDRAKLCLVCVARSVEKLDVLNKMNLARQFSSSKQ